MQQIRVAPAKPPMPRASVDIRRTAAEVISVRIPGRSVDNLARVARALPQDEQRHQDRGATFIASRIF
jgi:hypothetical protein